jgi:hypothetical protein
MQEGRERFKALGKRKRNIYIYIYNFNKFLENKMKKNI